LGKVYKIMNIFYKVLSKIKEIYRKNVQYFIQKVLEGNLRNHFDESN